MSQKSNVAEPLLYGMIILLIIVAGISCVFHIMTLFEFYQSALSALVLYATILMTITSSKTAKASEKQAAASEKQTIASELQARTSIEAIKAAVQPALSFSIRPANDYYSTRFNTSTWLPGVGIYIESIGIGHALNIKFKCKVIGEDESHSFDISFKRMLVGQIYTIPSKPYPKLKIEKSHKQIIIDSVEFDDVRKPPNNYKIDEPETLDIYPEYFDERDMRHPKIG